MAKKKTATYKKNRSANPKMKNSRGGKTTVTHKTNDVKKVKQTAKGKAQDKRVKALPAGIRKTKSGSTYYENRINRSDNKK